MRLTATRVVAATCLAFAVVSPVVASAAPGQAGGVPKCHGLTATIVGTSGDDHLRGTTGRDVIVGLAGNDVIGGHRGADVICGGDDGDRLFGGPGNDRLYGQGNDAET